MSEEVSIPPSSEAQAGPGFSGRLRWAGPALTSAALLGIAALEYRMPDNPRFIGPLNPEGSREFAHALFRATLSPMGTQTYRWLFSSLVLAAWAAYSVVLWTGLKGRTPTLRQILWTSAITSGLLAVFFPTSLSHDLYAYLGFARAGPVHGLNPYTTTLAHMAAIGDWAAARYPAPHGSIYGPAWTLLTSAVASTMRATGFVPQAIALKAIQAAAIPIGASAAHSLAGKWEPGRATLAASAFAFNPLLLMEGPGSGHVDILMVAIMLWGLALVERSRWRSGYLMLGLSAAIKFISVALIPMVVIRQMATLPGKQRVPRLLGSLAFSAAPFIIGFAPYWDGPRTLRPVFGLAATRAGPGARGAWHFSAVIVLYLALLAWQAADAQKRFPGVWVAWSTISIQLLFPGTLPWYFAWPIGPVVTRWRRYDRYLTFACMALAARWTLIYVQMRGG